MIMLGSGAEYGKQDPVVQVQESFFDTRVPSDEYGLYKYVCAQYASEVDFITHLRLFAVFGKYEDYEIRFISNAICKALLGLPITMRQNVRFDYLFIDDFIRILEKIIEHSPKEVCINVGRGVGVDLKTIANMVQSEVGSSVPILIANSGFGNEYTCATDLLMADYPQTTFTPFELAIAKLVAYYRILLPTIDTQLFLRDI
jgi:GDP-L-fucose synthase